MNEKLRKYFLVLLLLFVGSGCANDVAEKKADAAKQKAIKQEERQKTLLINAVNAYATGVDETSFKLDKKFKKVDDLIKSDFRMYKDKEKIISDLFHGLTVNSLQSNDLFLSNAPDFTDLKSQASTLIGHIDEAHILFQDFTSKEAATKRAQDAGLDKKYQKIYLEVYNLDKTLETRQTEMFELVDELRGTAQHLLDKMTFLSEHQHEWVNENGTVAFYNDAAYNAYQAILNQVGN